MYQIAICDDEPNELNKTQTLLEAYQQVHPECHFSIHKFTSISALKFEMTKQDTFDLLLMDIYMPEKNGIDGTRELRKNGFDGPVIFLTASTTHAMDAFCVEAVQYLLKPVAKDRFFAVMEKVFRKQTEERRRYLALRTEGETRKVSIQKIIYSESQNHHQIIHLADGEELRIRMTLTAFYEIVGTFSGFVRVGSTYIVNLGYVDSLTSKTVRLINGKSIWLPRGSYTVLKERYFEFYRSGREKKTNDTA